MIVAYLQWFLIISAFVVLLRNRYQLRYLESAPLVLLIVAVVLAIPTDTIPIYGYLWGVFGQISIVTTFLLGRYLVTNLNKDKLHFLQFGRHYLYAPVALLAAVFYPLVLGLSPIDPYNWGFQPLYLSIILLGIASIYWILKERVLAWLLLVVVICHQIGLLESDNLWDYLFDPFLVFYSWGWAVRRLVGFSRNLLKT